MGALDGKIAIVTGAGQGVGRCHAERLAAEGAAVVVNDLSAAADETAALIRDAGGSAVAHRCDVSDWDAASGLIAAAVAEYGDLHIVVNNAGFISDAMTVSMTEDQFDRVVRVHLHGHFAVSSAAARLWRERSKLLSEGAPMPGRRLIMTASESGLFGGPGQANYGSAKGGILAMTMIMARELDRYGVTVNCIAPRARTPMTQANPKFNRPEEGFDKYDPANISPMVAWLASDRAVDVTGQTFIVLGDQIHRVQRPRIASSIVAGGVQWSVDAIDSARAELFGDEPTGVPPWGGPPM